MSVSRLLNATKAAVSKPLSFGLKKGAAMNPVQPGQIVAADRWNFSKATFTFLVAGAGVLCYECVILESEKQRLTNLAVQQAVEKLRKNSYNKKREDLMQMRYLLLEGERLLMRQTNGEDISTRLNEFTHR